MQQKKKIKAIIHWQTPTSLHDVRSFQGLATLYKRFIKYFSTIKAPITECMKKGQFNWTKATLKALEEVKRSMTTAPIVAQLDLSKVF